MILAEKLTAGYPGKTVLKDCSLHVLPGEKCALMGPSGCGKTTLLKLLLGLMKPLSGRSEIRGKAACVFQEPRLLPWRTAAENVNVVLADKGETLPEARAWLEKLGLGEAAGLYPDELSGGMKQRTAIARALAYGGEALLLDEPLKGLDQALKQRTAELILENSRDKAILLVTHDREEAALLADRVLVYADRLFLPEEE
ncbi:MAG: ATP-binding cassette domain-containing protein [Oscillospiraceae bacterium]|nr:ATP-binding cassette domain-containing protein [Oscillospiraceae bacterium]